MDTTLMRPYLREGDIVLTRATGFLGRAIRWFSRVRKESPTMVNHVGIITRGGPVWLAELTEALWRVRTHRFWKRYGDSKKHTVAVYRPTNIDRDEAAVIARYALVKFQNRPYGVLKIALHAADRLIGNRYFFRRMGRLKSYPICSFLVADAYGHHGLNFGVPVAQAQPDDIWDYVVNSDNYEEVLPLGTLQ